MNRKILAVLLTAIMIVPVFVTMTMGDGSEAETTVVVESSPDFAPYDYYYGDEFTGIDMDILRAIGMDTGINITFRQNLFDSILLSVTQHKCDFGASGFTISEERKQSVDFTEPYSVIRQVVVAKAGLDITSEADVKGKVMSVQTGTSGADYAKTLTSPSNIIYQKGYTEIVLDLINGKAFCEVVDDAVGMAQVSAHPELQVYDVLEAEPEYYGFIFAKDNEALYKTINDSLIKLKENGTVADIIKYYADNGFSLDTPSYFNRVNTLFILTCHDVPFSYMANGFNAGIDADILRAISKDIDYKIRFKQVDFKDIFKELETNPSYIGAAGIFDTPERREHLSFSDSYMSDKLVVLAPKNSDITDISVLESKSIAVVIGNESDTYAESKGYAVNRYTENSAAAAKVSSGVNDCAIMDRTMAKAQINNHPDLEIRDILTDVQERPYAFAFSPDATNLYEIVNASLLKLKADGTIDDILAYYEKNGYGEGVPSYFDDESEKSFFDKLWDKFTKDFLDMDRYQYLTNGLANTLKITVMALIMGMIIGSVAAMVVSMSAQTGKWKIPAAICRVYITVIRGTPVMVQLLIIYYIVFASSDMNQILIASIAFGLNSGAYVAEVVRSGINSVPKGQMEAARSLGLSTGASMKLIILPQAIRNILPALGNEAISLIKETSVAGYIGVMELTRGADIIRGQTYDALLPLLVIAAVYLAIVLILQYLIKKMEKRLNNAY
ncbi:MAG: ABC transporter permease subunit [archaeon]|nr:ABC transporter permease subunit [archaeon]